MIMGKKTKRQQPRPKRKRYTSTASKELRTQRELFKVIGKKMMAFLKDKEGLTNIIQEHISCISNYWEAWGCTLLTIFLIWRNISWQELRGNNWNWTKRLRL